MLWEAAALRLVLAHGLQREPFQSVYVMMHVILQSRRPIRPQRQQCRQRLLAPALVLCLEQLVPFFGPAVLRARGCELRKTSMMPHRIADHGHYHWAVEKLPEEMGGSSASCWPWVFCCGGVLAP